MPETLLEKFSRFIEVNMGLSFPREKWGDLEKGIHSICRQFGSDDEEAFVRFVISTPLSKRQIEMFASGLTIGETYFFREKKMFDALKHIVRSDFVRIRSGSERQLRIWSAGCSSGEEPYSIAMTLKKLLPYLRDYQITILATDINPLVLEKGEKGVYTNWSFRGVPENIITSFFKKTGDGFEISPEIKKMVRFSYHNLMKDDYPSQQNNTDAMDLIFCRNALMYFSPETIKSVTHKFHRCLKDGGRLIVSQTELNDEYFQFFEKGSHEGALFFVKSSADMLPHSDPRGILQWKPKKTPPPSPDLPFRPQRVSEGGASKDTKRPLHGTEGNAAELTQKARTFANMGLLNDAIQLISEAITADRMDPGRHYLHSAILGEMGLKMEAIEALKKAVYLDADFALAYFAMGNLSFSTGNILEAERHFDTALMLLRKHGNDDILPESEGMPVWRLVELIEAMKGRKEERR
jgi:chemotaxis protein methyltransferase CheR